MQELGRELGLRLPRPFLGVINGRLYLRGDSFLSPGLLLVPFAYLRFALRLEGRWRQEWLPEVRSVADRWELDVKALSDCEIRRGIDELARAGARYWRAAYLPRLAGVSERLFTLFYGLVACDDDPHIAVLLGDTGAAGAAVAVLAV